MANGAFKNAVFKVAYPAGGTVFFDMTPYLTQVTVTENGNAIDTSVAGINYKSYIQGQVDLVLNAAGIYDPAVGTVLHSLGTAGFTGYQYFPQGTAGTKWAGTAMQTNHTTPGSIDNAVTWTADYQNTGVPTYS